MRVERFAILGPVLLRPQRHGDERGFLSETFQADRFGTLVGMPAIVQENQVFSHRAGTVRGLHAQAPPSAQAKLVAVLAGRIRDVGVDVRQGSPTYGQHVSAELSAADGAMLYVPRGFLHGYCTLQDETLVQYKLDAVYAQERELAVRFDDPVLGIDWGWPADEAVVSAKDRAAFDFATFASPFRWSDES